jgi:acetyl esterase/lipase
MSQPPERLLPNFLPIGPLPTGCPKAEDIFSPDLLAKYNPQIVRYVLMSMAPGMPPATHEVDLKEVRENPARFAPPWQKDMAYHERVGDHAIYSQDKAVIYIRVYRPDAARFGPGPYGVHLNFHGE